MKLYGNLESSEREIGNRKEKTRNGERRLGNGNKGIRNGNSGVRNGKTGIEAQKLFVAFHFPNYDGALKLFSTDAL